MIENSMYNRKNYTVDVGLINNVRMITFGL